MKCFSFLLIFLISCGSKNKTQIKEVETKPPTTTPQVLRLESFSKLNGKDLEIWGACEDVIKVDLEIKELLFNRSVFCYDDEFVTSVNLPISLDGKELTYKIITENKTITKKVLINFDTTKIFGDLEFNLNSESRKLFSDLDCKEELVKKKGSIKCIKSGSTTFVANSKKSAPTLMNDSLYFQDSLLVNKQDLINGLDSFEVILVVKADALATDAGLLDVHRFENDDDVFSLRYDTTGVLSYCSECVKGAISTTYDTYYVESGSFTQSREISMIGMSWSSGSSLKTYYNGVKSIASNEKKVFGKIQAPETLYLGHGPKGSWNGRIYEFYFFKQELTSETRDFLYKRLSKKYL